MARLCVATGDAIARLDETGGAWSVELSLRGSGAQCVAVDPGDGDTAYAGLVEGGRWARTSDGARTWTDCELPAPRVDARARAGVPSVFLRVTGITSSPTP